MRIHSGEKPYSCKECEYSSTRAHILKRRMLTHSPEKPFHCTHCTSSFTQRGHFKEHMSTHSGERRFSCDQCNYSCIQANDIKKHMLQHSGEKPFACNQCSFSCRRPSSWNITSFPTLVRNPLLARNANTHAGSPVISKLTKLTIPWESQIMTLNVSELLGQHSQFLQCF